MCLQRLLRPLLLFEIPAILILSVCCKPFQAQFKELTGKDFGPPKKEKKPKGEGGDQAPSEKNKAKNAAKAEAKRKKVKNKV